MRHFLVTGAAGNVGAALCDKLSANTDHFVVAVDDLSTGSAAKLPLDRPNLILIRADVNELHDLTPIMVRYPFEFVFHYAAVVGVQRTLNHPLHVLRDIDGIRNVLHLAKTTGVRRVIFSSSSEVYGEPVEIPQREDTTPLNSRLPYAVVKNVAEVYLKTYQREFGLSFVILRFFNTYGPRQSTDFVIPRFLRAALANEDIFVYGDGHQTRTFCYIDDNIDATWNIVCDDRWANATINIGSDVEWRVIDVARLVVSITGSRSTIRHLPPLPEGDMTRRCPDATIMRRSLGRELTTLETGIKRLLAVWGPALSEPQTGG